MYTMTGSMCATDIGIRILSIPLIRCGDHLGDGQAIFGCYIEQEVESV